MSDFDEFVATTVREHEVAVTGVRNGDATALIDMLGKEDPVTLFPASQPTRRGCSEVQDAFRRVASAYSDASPVEFELMAAGLNGELAYGAGIESGLVSVGGQPAALVRLRVTQVYRRDASGWRLVHRHADPDAGSGEAVSELRAPAAPRGPAHQKGDRCRSQMRIFKRSSPPWTAAVLVGSAVRSTSQTTRSANPRT